MEILDKYVIKQGDTIHTISQKAYGSINQTMEIIIANDLVYPFINPTNSEEIMGVKIPGDTLIMPREIGDSPGMLDTIGEEHISGSDLYLNMDDEGQLETYYNRDILANRNNDLQTVSQEESLRQDLIHRLITPPGSLVCHPNWGSQFLSIIGSKDLYGWREKASIELESCFRSDDRVIDVINVEIIDIPLGIELSCDIVTKNGMISIIETLGR